MVGEEEEGEDEDAKSDHVSVLRLEKKKNNSHHCFKRWHDRMMIQWDRGKTFLNRSLGNKLSKK